MTKAAPLPNPPHATTASRADLTAEQLVAAAGAGDQGAFAQLYERLAAPVLTTALRVLGNRALAEEVAQEVMVELWRTAAHFTAAKGTATAWALTTARRHAVDRAGRATAEQVADHEEYARVQVCLSGLPEAHRQAVTMACHRGMTYREVAADLGAPPGAVTTRMREALIRLGEHLRAVT
ncbi:sigma-70 family RNA polymerase sigma factor [Actinokineospora sp. G85]|uniref:sigma-70 family RNA polymerase sigma factor n=1 Tax=Actinokineospora sp. G85 TaxID=3406626 RepID=UPI003C746387